MPTPLTDATQTQTLAGIPRRHAAPEMPPAPPPDAILESLAAAPKMRRPAQAQGDAFTSRFAPWAKGSAPEARKVFETKLKAMPVEAPEPPVFTVPVEEQKLEALKTALGILAGRIKATTKDNPIAALFGAALIGDDPFLRAIRVRRITGSALSFGQRATQATTKTREGGAYLVLQIETADAERIIEVRVAVQRLHPHSGRTGSFLEVIGSAPLANPADIKLVDNMRQRLIAVWGRDSARA